MIGCLLAALVWQLAQDPGVVPAWSSRWRRHQASLVVATGDNVNDCEGYGCSTGEGYHWRDLRLGDSSETLAYRGTGGWSPTTGAPECARSSGPSPASIAIAEHIAGLLFKG